MGRADDDPRGRLVRPYAVTRGRTEATRTIAIEALLETTTRGTQESQYGDRDRRRIVQLCGERPQSLAEVAAHLRLPLGVARVVVDDMVSAGLLLLHEIGDPGDFSERIDVLERVLIGLHRL
jgi:hypothetical protein